MLLEAPFVLLAYNQCSMLPRRQQTSNKWRYRKRLPMLLAHNHAARSLCCACQPWQYRTANRTASGSLQCCGLQPRSMLPLLRLQTVALPHCKPHCKWLPSMLRLTTTQHAPFTAPANRGTTALQTALQVAPFNAAAYNHAACSLYCACQPWHYRTANRTASGSLQCCGLQPRSMLPLLRLP
jgi:hypothetical protein